MSKVDLDYTLDDKYLLDEGKVFLSGTQALVKLPLIQKKIDEWHKNNKGKDFNKILNKFRNIKRNFGSI